MQYGLAISVVLHAALLAWALLTIQSTPALRVPEPEAIAVALITPSELLQLKKGSETAKELEAKTKEEPKPDTSKVEAPKPNPILAPTPPAEAPPPPQEVATAEPPPVPEPSKPDPIAEKLAATPPPPEATPGPTPDELKAQEEAKQKAEAEKKKAEDDKKKAEDKKKTDDKRKLEQKKLADAKKKAEDAKKQADPADRLAALLNKDPSKKGAPVSGTPPTKPADYTGPTAGASKGDSPVLSVREQDLLRGMLRSQIARCWRLPGAGGGTETPIVTLKWRMRPDGSLEGEPQIDKPASGPMASLATEAAIRAVKGCQPYDLPKDLYATGWKDVTWEFDPSQML